MQRLSAARAGSVFAVALALCLCVAPRTADAGITVTFHAGWNLAAGPDGTRFAGANGPLYTLQAGDRSYASFPAGSPATAGYGYWVYFPAARTVSLPDGLSALTVDLPAAQWVLIGNPSGTQTLPVSGADALFTFDPARGYRAAAALQPGQGAWAFSKAGGTLSLGGAGGP